MSESKNILELIDVNSEYSLKSLDIFGKNKKNKVLNNINLTIRRNEFFGLVGESGCGKSTLAKAILGLIEFEGEIIISGQKRDKKNRKTFAKYVQAVFQDPLSALNPRKTIGFMLEEPLKIHKIGTKSERYKQVNKVLELIGLDSSYRKRYPNELSGGQRQRVCIGCALMLNSQLIVADEAISALDVSVGAQILNLFQDIHDNFELSLLFISHNLNVVYYLCDRIAVMYRGNIVELGTAEDIYKSPLHPYTKLLLSSVPDIEDKDFKIEDLIEKEPEIDSDLIWQGNRCPFYERCNYAKEICNNQIPKQVNVGKDDESPHLISCFLYSEN